MVDTEYFYNFDVNLITITFNIKLKLNLIVTGFNELRHYWSAHPNDPQGLEWPLYLNSLSVCSLSVCSSQIF